MYIRAVRTSRAILFHFRKSFKTRRFIIANISSGAEAEITTGDITVTSEEDGAGIAASVINGGSVEISFDGHEFD